MTVALFDILNTNDFMFLSLSIQTRSQIIFIFNINKIKRPCFTCWNCIQNFILIFVKFFNYYELIKALLIKPL